MPLTPGTSSATNAGYLSSSKREIPVVCHICGVTFLTTRWHAPRAKYCGRRCYYKSMAPRGTIVLNCDVCGKEYYRSPSHAHYAKKTCSMKCRGMASRTAEPGSGDYPLVRRWMRRRDMIKACSRCGYDVVPNILVIHHVDRDRTNNTLTNLKVLCPNCHAIEHLPENKGGWHHASTKRK